MKRIKKRYLRFSFVSRYSLKERRWFSEVYLVEWQKHVSEAPFVILWSRRQRCGRTPSRAAVPIIHQHQLERSIRQIARRRLEDEFLFKLWTESLQMNTTLQHVPLVRQQAQSCVGVEQPRGTVPRADSWPCRRRRQRRWRRYRQVHRLHEAHRQDGQVRVVGQREMDAAQVLFLNAAKQFLTAQRRLRTTKKQRNINAHRAKSSVL